MISERPIYQKFNIKKTFHTVDPSRDNYLSRLFGVFNEDIVKLWCENSKSEYDYLGRPTLYAQNEERGTTLDFGLKSKDGSIFIGELKCELAYDKYKFIELNSIVQITHHKKEAFRRFLEIAKEPQLYIVKIKGKKVLVNGSILIWGRVDGTSRSEIIKYFNFSDILSIENMVNELIDWEDTNYKDYINTRYKWMKELITDLLGGVF